MNKSILLMLCICLGMVTRVYAQSSFASGNSTQNESNPVMKARLNSNGSNNLIIVGLQNVSGDNVINVTEVTPSGSLQSTNNYKLSFTDYPNVTDEYIADMIIDRDGDIVIYGICWFGYKDIHNTLINTKRPEPFILKIDGNTRSRIFCSTLRVNDPDNPGYYRGFTPGSIVEYHDGTGDYYYVSAVTYNNGNNDNDDYTIGGFAWLYVGRVLYSTGAFSSQMLLLEETTQDGTTVNVDHSNQGMMVDNQNRILVYGYYGNGSFGYSVKPYIYQVNPNLQSSGSNGIQAKYYFNSTGTSTTYQEGVYKLIQVPGSTDRYYMYGFDYEQSTGLSRGIISRILLTPPVSPGNNYGTASSDYLFTTSLVTANQLFTNIGDIATVPGSNNVLFTFTEEDLTVIPHVYRIRVNCFDGSTGAINWSGYSSANILNERSRIVVNDNRIHCSGIIPNSGSDDYYVFCPQIPADILVTPLDNLCYTPEELDVIPGSVSNIELSHLLYISYNDESSIFADPMRSSVSNTLYPCFNCLLVANNAATVVPHGTVINTNTVWGGIGNAQKYYVYGTVTVDNAVLDITNIDVVFGPCGRINFTNNGRLRANNSVFRPCNESDFWDGLYFTQSSDNKIESCVFKNASVGLLFNSDATGNVSNNQFFNCYRGVEVNGNTNFNNPIFNNKFIVDRLLPTTSECINGAPISICMGIMLDNAVVTDISQNQFLHNDNSQSAVQMWGIHSLSSSFTASENVFTNMYRAFEVDGERDLSNPWKIINNNIELTKQYVNNLSSIQAHQIYITGSVGNPNNEIIKNTIKRTDKEVLPNTAAIMIDPGPEFRISKLSIRENYIEGFNIGLYAISTSVVMVTRNTFVNCTGRGILFVTSNEMYISCNTIEMYDDLARLKYGIEIANCNYPNIPSTPNARPGKIHSNCIFNTDIAIFIYYIVPYAVAIDAPELRNNFLYNYISRGILIKGMNAAIGAPGSDGMNSFISNNIPAFDIDFQPGGAGPLPLVTQFNNYSNKAFNFAGIPIPANTVNTIKYSVASCAHQNQHMQGGVNFNGTYSNILDCESTTMFVPLPNPGGEGGGGPIGLVLRKTSGTNIMNMINSENWAKGDLSKVHEWMDMINQNPLLDQEAKNQANYLMSYKIQDVNLMSTLINANQNQSDFFYLEAVKRGLKEADSVRLLGIADKNVYSQISYFLLSEMNGRYRFNSTMMQPPSYDDLFSANQLGLRNLNIYPNPTGQNSVSVDINMPGLYDFKTISIVDFMGMEVFSSEIYLMHGAAQLDVSKLNAGVYYVVIKDENGKISTGKFVKL